MDFLGARVTAGGTSVAFGREDRELPRTRDPPPNMARRALTELGALTETPPGDFKSSADASLNKGSTTIGSAFFGAETLAGDTATEIGVVFGVGFCLVGVLGAGVVALGPWVEVEATGVVARVVAPFYLFNFIFERERNKNKK